jgi:hypothetical protein
MATTRLNIPKVELIQRIRDIISRGWIHTKRSRNDGAVGNTLEDLLEIPENNLAIANTLDWELKAQRTRTTSLITLFHLDPQPRKPTIVAKHLLPNYGWPHQKAGSKYPKSEMSFRGTIPGNRYTDRGFIIAINSVDRRVELEFDSKKVDPRHSAWLKNVAAKVGRGPINPKPFWEFDELHQKCVGKIKNTIFVLGNSRIIDGQEEFKYEKIELFEDFAFNRFLRGILHGELFVDFDARTGHNHGTKFRIRRADWKVLFSKITDVTKV